VTVYTGAIEGDYSTVGQMRTIGAAMAAAFDAIGFIRTSDTGQIDWATAALPGTGQYVSGYEIRRFSDPLQGTAPIFAKLEYNRNAATPYGLGIRWTFGTGSNGSGTLTGTTWQHTSLPYTYTRWVTGGTRPIWASSQMDADGARIGVVFAPDTLTDASVEASGVFIQRTVDVDGTPNTDGFFVLVAEGGGATSTQNAENFYDFADGGGWRGASPSFLRTDSAGFPLQIAPVSSFGVRNGVVYPVPWLAMGRSRVENALPDWLLYHESTILRSGEDVPLDRLGASHTYRSTGIFVSVPAFGATNYDWRLMTLWE
jgi:hypothetical protein